MTFLADFGEAEPKASHAQSKMVHVGQVSSYLKGTKEDVCVTMSASKIWDVQENDRDDWSRWNMRPVQTKVERTRQRHRVWSLMLASAAVNDAALTDEHTQSKTIIMDAMWNRLQSQRLFPIGSSWSCLFWIILISLMPSQKKKRWESRHKRNSTKPSASTWSVSDGLPVRSVRITCSRSLLLAHLYRD